ncbi:MAG: outer membrane beta-barrel protein [Myxococcales bacterium]|nr:outer membrane beta-barrel protein [Myxococcales bacterium]
MEGRRMVSWAFLLIAAVMAALPVRAQQQPVITDPGTAPPPPGYGPAPAPPPATAQPVAAAEPAPAPRQGRGLEYGGYLVFPIFVSGDERSIAPNVGFGIGLLGRLGWELEGGLTLEGHLGGQANVIEGSDATVNAGWIGGAVRYSFLGESALVPFLSAGLQFTVWSVTVCEEDAFGTTVCVDVSSEEATLGLHATAGLAYELSRELAFEGGVTFNYAFRGDAFYVNEPYVSPFVGLTLYY